MYHLFVFEMSYIRRQRVSQMRTNWDNMYHNWYTQNSKKIIHDDSARKLGCFDCMLIILFGKFRKREE